jgi:acylphosphatase
MPVLGHKAVATRAERLTLQSFVENAQEGVVVAGVAKRSASALVARFKACRQSSQGVERAERGMA